MKLTINNKNQIVAEAENKNESLALIHLAHTGEKQTKEGRDKKSRKKHLFVKKCEICGKRCKGAAGLGVHKRRAHSEKNWTSRPRFEITELPITQG